MKRYLLASALLSFLPVVGADFNQLLGHPLNELLPPDSIQNSRPRNPWELDYPNDQLPDHPLNEPCLDGNLEEVRRLCDEGVKIDDDTHYNNYALHSAAEQRHLDVVTLLLERGANPNRQWKSPFGILESPFHSIIDNGEKDEYAPIIHKLLRYGADPNLADNKGNTPLHRCVRFRFMRHVAKVAETLLENGANPFIKNKKGKTPREMCKSDGWPIKKINRMRALFEQGEENFKRPHIRMLLHGTSQPMRRKVAIAKRPSKQATNLLETSLPKWNEKEYE